MEDIFTIANKNFNSRLIVGTGKYKNFKETATTENLDKKFLWSCIKKAYSSPYYFLATW